MAYAYGSGRSLSGIRDSISGLQKSIAATTKSASSIFRTLRDSNLQKKKGLSSDSKFFKMRRDSVRKKEREDLLEASSTSRMTIASRPSNSIVRSTKGFLGRIMDFVGTLLVGWAVVNLPKIIKTIEDFSGRLQEYSGVIRDFFGGTIDLFTAFGEGIGGIFTSITNLNFETFKTSIENSTAKMNDAFKRMVLSTERGIQMLAQDSQGLLQQMNIDLKDFDISKLFGDDSPSNQVNFENTDNTTYPVNAKGQPITDPPTSGPVDTGYKDYKGRPIKLSAAAAEAFKAMAEAAEADGIANLGSYITSSLRDPQKNAGVGGVEGSNHLTGNAFDINMMNPGPGDEWIRANGSKFGFIYNTYSPDSTHFDFDSSKYQKPPTTQSGNITPPKQPDPPGRGNLFQRFNRNFQTRSSIISQPQTQTVATNNIIINGAPQPTQRSTPVNQGASSIASLPTSSLNSGMETFFRMQEHTLSA